MLNGFYSKVDCFDIAEVNSAFDFHGIITAIAARIMLERFIHKFGEWGSSKKAKGLDSWAIPEELKDISQEKQESKGRQLYLSCPILWAEQTGGVLGRASCYFEYVWFWLLLILSEIVAWLFPWNECIGFARDTHFFISGYNANLNGWIVNGNNAVGANCANNMVFLFVKNHSHMC